MSSEVRRIARARYSRDQERLHDLGKTSKTFTLIYTLPHSCPLMPLFSWRNYAADLASSSSWLFAT